MNLSSAFFLKGLLFYNYPVSSNASAEVAEPKYLCWLVAVLSFLGFVENMMVFWILGFQLKRNSFTVYILNLAVADAALLFGICIVSVCYASLDKSSKIKFYIVEAVEIALLFGYNTGLYLLTAISVERCLSVLFPIWYRCQRPKNQSSIVCLLLWVLSVLMTGIEYSFCLQENGFSAECWIVSVVICCETFLVFTPIMVLCSMTLAIKVHQTSWNSPSSNLYLTILLTVIMFFLCAMPLRILYILLYMYHFRVLYRIFPIVLLLSSINSGANPLVYFFVGSSAKKRFKEPLKEVLKRVFDCECVCETEIEYTEDTVDDTETTGSKF
uniref:Proto-oncogene Mas-like n=1 Tax=Geotrypetes seraphini TaxID=260995 RepID=A0A6P8P433_GEOSA|nr:proto-oncogene Mas-like [Geotrypetes seraphini]